MLRRGRQAVAGRRSGPADEPPWWEPSDQAFVEGPLTRRVDFGKGWIPAPMFNNAERLDPYGDDPGSVALREVRAQRRLTALDEGTAWRHRGDGALVVFRLEVFAEADDAAHRAAWRTHGAACLDALWRARWRERDREPGWVEARWRHEPDRPAPFGPLGGQADPQVASRVDWITIEDHTGAAETEVVTAYQHLTCWAGRAHATMILRHDQRFDLDPTIAAAAAALVSRLGTLGA